MLPYDILNMDFIIVPGWNINKILFALHQINKLKNFEFNLNNEQHSKIYKTHRQWLSQ